MIPTQSLRINQDVMTPLGKGIVQQAYAVQDDNKEPVIKGIVVRLPVNDVTRSKLNKSNCLTPHANLSALFVFQESEIK